MSCSLENVSNNLKKNLISVLKRNLSDGRDLSFTEELLYEFKRYKFIFDDTEEGKKDKDEALEMLKNIISEFISSNSEYDVADKESKKEIKITIKSKIRSFVKSYYFNEDNIFYKNYMNDIDELSVMRDKIAKKLLDEIIDTSKNEESIDKIKEKLEEDENGYDLESLYIPVDDNENFENMGDKSGVNDKIDYPSKLRYIIKDKVKKIAISDFINYRFDGEANIYENIFKPYIKALLHNVIFNLDYTSDKDTTLYGVTNNGAKVRQYIMNRLFRNAILSLNNKGKGWEKKKERLLSIENVFRDDKKTFYKYINLYFKDLNNKKISDILHSNSSNKQKYFDYLLFRFEKTVLEDASKIVSLQVKKNKKNKAGIIYEINSKADVRKHFNSPNINNSELFNELISGIPRLHEVFYSDIKDSNGNRTIERIGNLDIETLSKWFGIERPRSESNEEEVKAFYNKIQKIIGDSKYIEDRYYPRVKVQEYIISITNSESKDNITYNSVYEYLHSDSKFRYYSFIQGEIINHSSASIKFEEIGKYKGYGNDFMEFYNFVLTQVDDNYRPWTKLNLKNGKISVITPIKKDHVEPVLKDIVSVYLSEHVPESMEDVVSLDNYIRIKNPNTGSMESIKLITFTIENETYAMPIIDNIYKQKYSNYRHNITKEATGIMRYLIDSNNLEFLKEDGTLADEKEKAIQEKYIDWMRNTYNSVNIIKLSVARKIMNTLGFPVKYNKMFDVFYQNLTNNRELNEKMNDAIKKSGNLNGLFDIKFQHKNRHINDFIVDFGIAIAAQREVDTKRSFNSDFEVYTDFFERNGFSIPQISKNENESILKTGWFNHPWVAADVAFYSILKKSVYIYADNENIGIKSDKGGTMNNNAIYKSDDISKHLGVFSDVYKNNALKRFGNNSDIHLTPKIYVNKFNFKSLKSLDEINLFKKLMEIFISSAKQNRNKKAYYIYDINDRSRQSMILYDHSVGSELKMSEDDNVIVLGKNYKDILRDRLINTKRRNFLDVRDLIINNFKKVFGKDNEGEYNKDTFNKIKIYYKEEKDIDLSDDDIKQIMQSYYDVFDKIELEDNPTFNPFMKIKKAFKKDVTGLNIRLDKNLFSIFEGLVEDQHYTFYGDDLSIPDGLILHWDLWFDMLDKNIDIDKKFVISLKEFLDKEERNFMDKFKDVNKKFFERLTSDYKSFKRNDFEEIAKLSFFYNSLAVRDNVDTIMFGSFFQYLDSDEIFGNDDFYKKYKSLGDYFRIQNKVIHTSLDKRSTPMTSIGRKISKEPFYFRIFAIDNNKINAYNIASPKDNYVAEYNGQDIATPLGITLLNILSGGKFAYDKSDIGMKELFNSPDHNTGTKILRKMFMFYARHYGHASLRLYKKMYSDSFFRPDRSDKTLFVYNRKEGTYKEIKAKNVYDVVYYVMGEMNNEDLFDEALNRRVLDILDHNNLLKYVPALLTTTEALKTGFPVINSPEKLDKGTLYSYEVNASDTIDILSKTENIGEEERMAKVPAQVINALIDSGIPRIVSERIIINRYALSSSFEKFLRKYKGDIIYGDNKIDVDKFIEIIESKDDRNIPLFEKVLSLEYNNKIASSENDKKIVHNIVKNIIVKFYNEELKDRKDLMGLSHKAESLLKKDISSEGAFGNVMTRLIRTVNKDTTMISNNGMTALVAEGGRYFLKGVPYKSSEKISLSDMVNKMIIDKNGNQYKIIFTDKDIDIEGYDKVYFDGDVNVFDQMGNTIVYTDNPEYIETYGHYADKVITSDLLNISKELKDKSYLFAIGNSRIKIYDRQERKTFYKKNIYLWMKNNTSDESLRELIENGQTLYGDRFEISLETEDEKLSYDLVKNIDIYNIPNEDAVVVRHGDIWKVSFAGEEKNTNPDEVYKIVYNTDEDRILKPTTIKIGKTDKLDIYDHELMKTLYEIENFKPYDGKSFSLHTLSLFLGKPIDDAEYTSYLEASPGNNLGYYFDTMTKYDYNKKVSDFLENYGEEKPVKQDGEDEKIYKLRLKEYNDMQRLRRKQLKNMIANKLRNVIKRSAEKGEAKVEHGEAIIMPPNVKRLMIGNFTKAEIDKDVEGFYKTRIDSKEYFSKHKGFPLFILYNGIKDNDFENGYILKTIEGDEKVSKEEKEKKEIASLLEKIDKIKLGVDRKFKEYLEDIKNILEDDKDNKLERYSERTIKYVNDFFKTKINNVAKAYRKSVENIIVTRSPGQGYSSVDVVRSTDFDPSQKNLGFFNSNTINKMGADEDGDTLSAYTYWLNDFGEIVDYDKYFSKKEIDYLTGNVRTFYDKVLQLAYDEMRKLGELIFEGKGADENKILKLRSTYSNFERDKTFFDKIDKDDEDEKMRFYVRKFKNKVFGTSHYKEKFIKAVEDDEESRNIINDKIKEKERELSNIEGINVDKEIKKYLDNLHAALNNLFHEKMIKDVTSPDNFYRLNVPVDEGETGIINKENIEMFGENASNIFSMIAEMNAIEQGKNAIPQAAKITEIHNNLLRFFREVKDEYKDVYRVLKKLRILIKRDKVVNGEITDSIEKKYLNYLFSPHALLKKKIFDSDIFNFTIEQEINIFNGILKHTKDIINDKRYVKKYFDGVEKIEDKEDVKKYFKEMYGLDIEEMSPEEFMLALDNDIDRGGWYNLSVMMTMSVDNAKTLLFNKLNISEDAIRPFGILLLLGYDFRDVIDFLNQDVIIDVFNTLKKDKKKKSLSRCINDKKEVVENIVSRYEKERLDFVNKMAILDNYDEAIKREQNPETIIVASNVFNNDKNAPISPIINDYLDVKKALEKDDKFSFSGNELNFDYFSYLLENDDNRVIVMVDDINRLIRMMNYPDNKYDKYDYVKKLYETDKDIYFIDSNDVYGIIRGVKTKNGKKMYIRFDDDISNKLALYNTSVFVDLRDSSNSISIANKIFYDKDLIAKTREVIESNIKDVTGDYEERDGEIVRKTKDGEPSIHDLDILSALDTINKIKEEIVLAIKLTSYKNSKNNSNIDMWNYIYEINKNFITVLKRGNKYIKYGPIIENIISNRDEFVKRFIELEKNKVLLNPLFYLMKDDIVYQNLLSMFNGERAIDVMSDKMKRLKDFINIIYKNGIRIDWQTGRTLESIFDSFMLREYFVDVASNKTLPKLVDGKITNGKYDFTKDETFYNFFHDVYNLFDKLSKENNNIDKEQNAFLNAISFNSKTSKDFKDKMVIYIGLQNLLGENKTEINYGLKQLEDKYPGISELLGLYNLLVYDRSNTKNTFNEYIPDNFYIEYEDYINKNSDNFGYDKLSDAQILLAYKSLLFSVSGNVDLPFKVYGEAIYIQKNDGIVVSYVEKYPGRIPHSIIKNYDNTSNAEILLNLMGYDVPEFFVDEEKKIKKKLISKGNKLVNINDYDEEYDPDEIAELNKNIYEIMIDINGSSIIKRIDDEYKNFYGSVKEPGLKRDLLKFNNISFDKPPQKALVSLGNPKRMKDMGITIADNKVYGEVKMNNVDYYVVQSSVMRYRSINELKDYMHVLGLPLKNEKLYDKNGEVVICRLIPKSRALAKNMATNIAPVKNRVSAMLRLYNDVPLYTYITHKELKDALSNYHKNNFNKVLLIIKGRKYLLVKKGVFATFDDFKNHMKKQFNIEVSKDDFYYSERKDNNLKRWINKELTKENLLRFRKTEDEKEGLPIYEVFPVNENYLNATFEIQSYINDYRSLGKAKDIGITVYGLESSEGLIKPYIGENDETFKFRNFPIDESNGLVSDAIEYVKQSMTDFFNDESYKYKEEFVNRIDNAVRRAMVVMDNDDVLVVEYLNILSHRDMPGSKYKHINFYDRLKYFNNYFEERDINDLRDKLKELKVLREIAEKEEEITVPKSVDVNDKEYLSLLDGLIDDIDKYLDPDNKVRASYMLDNNFTLDMNKDSYKTGNNYRDIETFAFVMALKYLKYKYDYFLRDVVYLHRIGNHDMFEMDLRTGKISHSRNLPIINKKIYYFFNEPTSVWQFNNILGSLFSFYDISVPSLILKKIAFNNEIIHPAYYYKENIFFPDMNIDEDPSLEASIEIDELDKISKVLKDTFKDKYVDRISGVYSVLEVNLNKYKMYKYDDGTITFENTEDLNGDVIVIKNPYTHFKDGEKQYNTISFKRDGKIIEILQFEPIDISITKKISFKRRNTAVEENKKIIKLFNENVKVAEEKHKIFKREMDAGEIMKFITSYIPATYYGQENILKRITSFKNFVDRLVKGQYDDFFNGDDLVELNKAKKILQNVKDEINKNKRLIDDEKDKLNAKVKNTYHINGKEKSELNKFIENKKEAAHKENKSIEVKQILHLFSGNRKFEDQNERENYYNKVNSLNKYINDIPLEKATKNKYADNVINIGSDPFGISEYSNIIPRSIMISLIRNALSKAKANNILYININTNNLMPKEINAINVLINAYKAVLEDPNSQDIRDKIEAGYILFEKNTANLINFSSGLESELSVDFSRAIAVSPIKIPNSRYLDKKLMNLGNYVFNDETTILDKFSKNFINDVKTTSNIFENLEIEKAVNVLSRIFREYFNEHYDEYMELRINIGNRDLAIYDIGNKKEEIIVKSLANALNEIGNFNYLNKNDYTDNEIIRNDSIILSNHVISFKEDKEMKLNRTYIVEDQDVNELIYENELSFNNEDDVAKKLKELGYNESSKGYMDMISKFRIEMANSMGQPVDVYVYKIKNPERPLYVKIGENKIDEEDLKRLPEKFSKNIEDFMKKGKVTLLVVDSNGKIAYNDYRSEKLSDRYYNSNSSLSYPNQFEENTYVFDTAGIKEMFSKRRDVIDVFNNIKPALDDIIKRSGNNIRFVFPGENGLEEMIKFYLFTRGFDYYKDNPNVLRKGFKVNVNDKDGEKFLYYGEEYPLSSNATIDNLPAIFYSYEGNVEVKNDIKTVFVSGKILEANNGDYDFITYVKNEALNYSKKIGTIVSKDKDKDLAWANVNKFIRILVGIKLYEKTIDIKGKDINGIIEEIKKANENDSKEGGSIFNMYEKITSFMSSSKAKIFNTVADVNNVFSYLHFYYDFDNLMDIIKNNANLYKYYITLAKENKNNLRLTIDQVSKIKMNNFDAYLLDITLHRDDHIHYGNKRNISHTLNEMGNIVSGIKHQDKFIPFNFSNLIYIDKLSVPQTRNTFDESILLTKAVRKLQVKESSASKYKSSQSNNLYWLIRSGYLFKLPIFINEQNKNEIYYYDYNIKDGKIDSITIKSSNNRVNIVASVSRSLVIEALAKNKIPITDDLLDNDSPILKYAIIKYSNGIKRNGLYYDVSDILFEPSVYSKNEIKDGDPLVIGETYSLDNGSIGFAYDSTHLLIKDKNKISLYEYKDGKFKEHEDINDLLIDGEFKDVIATPNRDGEFSRININGEIVDKNVLVNGDIAEEENTGKKYKYNIALGYFIPNEKQNLIYTTVDKVITSDKFGGDILKNENIQGKMLLVNKLYIVSLSNNAEVLNDNKGKIRIKDDDKTYKWTGTQWTIEEKNKKKTYFNTFIDKITLDGKEIRNQIVDKEVTKNIVERIADMFPNHNIMMMSTQDIAKDYNENYSRKAAFTYGDTIVFNSDKMTLDTPMHELGHVYLQYLKENNRDIYFHIIKESLKQKDLYSLTDSNLTQEDRANEVFSIALGFYSIDQKEKNNYLNEILPGTEKKEWGIITFFKKIFSRLFGVKKIDTEINLDDTFMDIIRKANDKILEGEASIFKGIKYKVDKYEDINKKPVSKALLFFDTFAVKEIDPVFKSNDITTKNYC